MRRALALGALLLGASLAAWTLWTPDRPNVLVVVIDDLGVDKVTAYGASSGPAMPRLDALAATGVRFTRAWSEPTCSATRASLLTGRSPHRTGVGAALGLDSPHALPFDETTLAELLGGAGYDTSAVGKWHLGSRATSVADNALRHGFAYHAGTVGNLGAQFHSHGRDQGYFRWEKTVQGELTPASGYATADTAADAVERVEQMTEPWFLWLAFHAGHEPLHDPPGTTPSRSEGRSVGRYDAMLEALDRHLGRVLDAMPPSVRARTVVVVVGDNGTPSHALAHPTPTKGTVFEGGIHVPLVVSGPGIAEGASSAALVQATDLFATVAELAQVHLPADVAQDSVSFAGALRDPMAPSARTLAFAEHFRPTGAGPYADYKRAATDGRFKLVERSGQPDALFDLTAAAGEAEDLLVAPLAPEAAAALARLREALPFPLDARLRD